MPALNTAILADRVAFHIIKGMEEQRRIALWKAFDQRALKRELLFFDKVRKLFSRQRAEVNNRLRRLQRSVEEVGYTGDTEGIVKGILKADDPIEPLLFRREEWGVTFQNEMTPLIEETVSSSGVQALSDVMVSVEFDVSNPRVAQFIQDKAYKFSFEVNDTTLKQLRKQLSQGVTRGESIYKLQKRVKHVFDIAETSRSVRIARTEVIGAANYGTFEGYRQSKVVEKKEWLSVKDARTRDSHAGMDGQVVALESPFSNGLMYPGDPSGPPEAVINCRCSTIAHVAKAEVEKTEAEIFREDFLGYAEPKKLNLNILETELQTALKSEMDALEKWKTVNYAIGTEDLNYQKAKALTKEAKKKFESSRKRLSTALRKRLQVNPTGVEPGTGGFETIHYAYDPIPRNQMLRFRKNTDRLAKEVSKFGKPEMFAKRVDFQYHKTIRAHSRGIEIHLEGLKPREDYVFHEFGHWLEETNKGISKSAREFYAYRTRDEISVEMGRGFATGEFTKKDKFIDDYMGRVYQSGDTEIVSCGMQYLYNDPVKLAVDDPEYFDFMYNVLRGNAWQ